MLAMLSRPLYLVLAGLFLVAVIVSMIFFAFNPGAFVLFMAAIIAVVGLVGFVKYREAYGKHAHHKRH